MGVSIGKVTRQSPTMNWTSPRAPASTITGKRRASAERLGVDGAPFFSRDRHQRSVRSLTPCFAATSAEVAPASHSATHTAQTSPACLLFLMPRDEPMPRICTTRGYSDGYLAHDVASRRAECLRAR